MRLLLALLLLAGQGWAALSPGTVAYYPLTADANDTSGNGYDLTTVGTITYASTGGRLSAGTFNASNYMTAPAGLRTAMQGLTAWTIEGYVYFNSGGSNKLFWSTNDANTYFLLLTAGSSGPLRSAIQGNILDKGTLTVGQWNQFAIAYDGTNRHTWINGVEADSTASSSALPASITSMFLGAYASGTGTAPCDCSISAVRYSNVYRSGPFPTTDPSSGPQYLSPYIGQGNSPSVTPRWNWPALW